MANLFDNGTTFENTVGSTAMHASSNASPTIAGITSAGCTAPNLVNQSTGVCVWVNSAPNTSAVYTFELMESGVSKASATMNGADIQPGLNHARWTTPYTFATLTANAYTIKITSTLNSGTLAAATSGLWYLISYNTSVTPGLGDNTFHAGFHNGGLTTKTRTLTGTSNLWGDGTRNLGSSLTRTMGAAVHVGNGFTLILDKVANCTLETRGSIFVTKGGTFDKGGNLIDHTITTKHIFDCNVANGDFGYHLPPSNFNGRILSQGNQLLNRRTQYMSGVGTAADPIVTNAAHNFAVDKEIVIPGITYNSNQVKYVKSIPAPNELIVSDTIGGAESAITNTPAVGSWIGNLSGNCVTSSKNTSFGYYLYNNSTNEEVSAFDYTRWEHASCASGPNLQFIASNTPTPASINGMVGYRNSASGRTSWSVGGTVAQDIDDCILFETLGSNYVGQSGMALSGASNKTVNRFLTYAAPGSTSCCAGLSLTSSSTNNTINDSHFYGCTANNGSLGYAIGLTIAHNNTFNDCTINNSRVRGMYFTDGFSNTFNNCNFGTTGSNNVDMFIASNSLGTALFNDCSFGSPTLLANMENALQGTDFAFQNMDGNDSKHEWHRVNGVFTSTGAGLADTTTRTAGSLALRIAARNATDGGTVIFKVPANPNSTVLAYGYLYRNATFSSGDLIAQLFLPGTTLADTPDATYTLPTTTGAWLEWALTSFYSGTEPRYATIRIIAKTATSGAYAYLDDIFDAGTLNKVAGLDLWDEGHISPIMVSADFSSIPEQTRLAVWSDTATYAPGEKGDDVKAILSNTDATQAKVDLL